MGFDRANKKRENYICCSPTSQLELYTPTSNTETPPPVPWEERPEYVKNPKLAVFALVPVCFPLLP